jgi:triacylglycerol lipase
MPGLKLGPITLRYFRGIDSALGDREREVFIPRVHPTAGIAHRAEQLKQQIVARLDQIGRGDDPVIIVAHSMGGLDARYMVSRLGMSSRVAAILSVTSPHRGSPMADWVVRNLDRRLPLLRCLGALGLNLQAAKDLTTEQCARFNDTITDVPGVKYFSVSAARPWHLVPAFAMPSHRIIASAEGENDGLVSVQSSQWGESLGTWAADHWHTINHKLVLEVRNPTGNIAPYYVRAVERIDRALAT